MAPDANFQKLDVEIDKLFYNLGLGTFSSYGSAFINKLF